MSNPKVRKAKKEVEGAKAAELRRIYEQRGELRPSVVVEEAASKESPLHNAFEWDNKKAGHEFRLWQARTMIRKYTVIVLSADGQEISDPFVHVPPRPDERKDDQEGAYHPMSVVIANVDMFSRALGELEGKLRAAMQAAQELKSAVEAAGDADKMKMAQVMLAMTAIQTASDVVKSLH